MTEPAHAYLFALNLLLIITDAGLGYFVAPLMLQNVVDEPEPSLARVASVRRMLALVVAFYMFFNCLAFFRGNFVLLCVVTPLALFDIVVQIILRRKYNRRPE